MTTLRISITKEVLEATKDCKSGLGITKNCAISHAIRDVWPEAITGPYEIYPFGAGAIYYKIRHNQFKFICKFDNASPKRRLKFKPFSFDIEVPDEVIGEVNIDEIRDIIKNSKTLELV